METIFALATARGRAGVAVFRISGPGAHGAVAQLCDLPVERRAALRSLVWQGEVIDQGLVLVFDEGRSFTGEAMAELHLHGSLATTAAMARVLSDIGLRQAEPGEFTRRALQNGKLDLTQVEGLADLIDAETEAQRRQAMRVLSGALGVKAETIKAHLLRASALVAALVDFSDEELPEGLLHEIGLSISAAQDMLTVELKGIGAAERIRDGFEVAIIGAPNVGKSTLINALAGREAAITSAVAGTTRDVIEVRMELGGLAVTLLDTAGLRETDDPVESIGIARARERAGLADLRLVLVDGGVGSEGVERGDLVVWTKSDMVAPPSEEMSISARTGAGIDRLVEAVTRELMKRTAGAATATHARHRQAMQLASDALESAAIGIKGGVGRLDFVGEDLRAALRALDSLVGKVDVEDLLDQIFSSFCIGK